MDMFKKFALSIASRAGFLVPDMAFAQTWQNILNIVDFVALIMNRLVGIAIIVAMFWFIWGLYNYIEGESKDPGKRANGIERMTMGTVAFFVIVSIWGLVRFLQNAFGLQGSSGNLQNREVPFVGEQVQR